MNRPLSIGLALLSAAVLAGCEKSRDAADTEETILLGPQYSSKNGLLLPEETRRSLELKVAEVTEQKVPAVIDLRLRVYKVNDQAGIATGSMCPEQALQLKTGQPMQVRLRNGETRSGKVLAVNSDLSKATDLAEVLVEIPGVRAEFELGAFLEGSAILEAQQSAVAVPRSALLQSVAGYSVYTVNGDHLLRTPVRIGASNANLVEIQDGLYAGDQVVLHPVMSLWMTELAAVKGGQACCVVPAKGK
jgi:hypothetical protein